MAKKDDDEDIVETATGDDEQLSAEDREAMTEQEISGLEGEDDAEADAGLEGDERDEGEPERQAEAGEADANEGDEGTEAADEGDEGTEAADEGDGKADAGEEGADAKAEDGKAADQGDQDDDSGDDDDFGPAIPNWQMPENAAEKTKEFDQQEDEINTKFKEGDLSETEYSQQLRKIMNERTALANAIDRAKMAWDMRLSHWSDRVVPKFFKQHPEYTKSETLTMGLDRHVRKLQEAGDNQFDPKLLRRAHRALQEELGIVKASSEPKAKLLAGKKGAEPPKGQKPRIPPTLARVPSDEIDDQTGGKFARLERLQAKDPLAYEEALERLSEADREAFLAGA